MILRSRFVVLFVFVTLCWIIQVFWYLSSTTTRSAVLVDEDATHNPAKKWSRDDFVETAQITLRESAFDQSHIQALCAKQKWVPGLVFECSMIQGGIGNVKMQILGCIRYAMDAGAGIVVPLIHTRGVEDLSDLDSGTVDLNYAFDLAEFLLRLRSTCPQMPIYADMDALETMGPVTKTEHLFPFDLPHIPTIAVLSVREKVLSWQAQSPPGATTLVPFGPVTSYYPVCHDGAPFADTFGRILPFSPDVLRLTASAIWTLRNSFSMPLSPNIVVSPALPKSPSFLGVHLRTSADILPDWPEYETQRDYYFKQMRDPKHGSYNLPLIYLASGNKSSIAQFTAETAALTPPVRVVTKEDLLLPDELEDLKAMTWDQQALVDYLILLRSSYFLGMAESSFSWLVATRRRVKSVSGSCGVRRGLWTGYLWGSALWDEFSDLWGAHPYGFEINLWP